LKSTYFFAIVFWASVISIEFLATTSLIVDPIQSSSIQMNYEHLVHSIHHPWDKANHFIAFLSLYITFSLVYLKLPASKKAIILLIFGIQIELVQYFLPYREFSILDMVADAIGIVVGILIIRIFWFMWDSRLRWDFSSRIKNRHML
jgi:VanZ family protein